MINNDVVEYRTLKRNGYCRVCLRDIPRDTEKVFVVSFANHGTYESITVCEKCIREFVDIANKEK